MLTFELVLCYWNNPEVLRKWLVRYLHHTDLVKYIRSGQGNLTIADTGSPTWDGYDVVNQVLKPFRYIRADTEAFRRRVPPGMHARPVGMVYNLATDYTKQDVIIYAQLGNIPPPDYFEQILALHEANERLVVQPKQHRLFSDTYWTEDYDKPAREAIVRGEMCETSGMPDWSVRRKWLEEVGGWDESMIAWGMVDVDLCCRFTGLMDTGIPAHEWVNERTKMGIGPYKNLGLELVRPGPKRLWSVVCQSYPGVQSYEDDSRKLAAKVTMAQWLGLWSIPSRNYGRVPVKHEVRE